METRKGEKNSEKGLGSGQDPQIQPYGMFGLKHGGGMVYPTSLLKTINLPGNKIMRRHTRQGRGGEAKPAFGAGPDWGRGCWWRNWDHGSQALSFLAAKNTDGQSLSP